MIKEPLSIFFLFFICSSNSPPSELIQRWIFFQKPQTGSYNFGRILTKRWKFTLNANNCCALMFEVHKVTFD